MLSVTILTGIGIWGITNKPISQVFISLLCISKGQRKFLDRERYWSKIKRISFEVLKKTVICCRMIITSVYYASNTKLGLSLSVLEYPKSVRSYTHWLKSYHLKPFSKILNFLFSLSIAISVWEFSLSFEFCNYRQDNLQFFMYHNC